MYRTSFTLCASLAEPASQELLDSIVAAHTKSLDSLGNFSCEIVYTQTGSELSQLLGRPHTKVYRRDDRGDTVLMSIETHEHLASDANDRQTPPWVENTRRFEQLLRTKGALYSLPFQDHHTVYEYRDEDWLGVDEGNLPSLLSKMKVSHPAYYAFGYTGEPIADLFKRVASHSKRTEWPGFVQAVSESPELVTIQRLFPESGKPYLTLKFDLSKGGVLLYGNVKKYRDGQLVGEHTVESNYVHFAQTYVPATVVETRTFEGEGRVEVREFTFRFEAVKDASAHTPSVFQLPANAKIARRGPNGQLHSYSAEESAKTLNQNTERDDSHEPRN